jgi:hypothetical protein
MAVATPVHFLELIALFKSLAAEKQNFSKKQLERLNSGIQSL